MQIKEQQPPLGSIPGGYHSFYFVEGCPLIYVSERFLNILGWTKEELQAIFGGSLTALVHPDDRDIFINYAELCASGAPVGDAVFRLRGKKGYRRVIYNAVVGEENGRKIVSGTVTDITDLNASANGGTKRPENENPDLENEVISAISSLFMQIYVVDLTDKKYFGVATENGKYGVAEQHGTTAEMREMAAKYLAAPEFCEFMYSFLDFETIPERLGDSHSLYAEIKGFDGKWYALYIIVQSRDSFGAVSRVLYVISDINDRKVKETLYEEKLMQTLEEVRRADIAKTDFLRRMSHDIRTPINGIRGMLEIAEHFPDDIEKQSECRRKIGEASGYLLSLVNNVLDMNKLESGKVIIEEKPFDLAELLKKSNSVAEINASEHGITYKVALDKCVINHSRVIGSPVHIQQILLNMTGNAVKYNRENGSVTVYTRETPVDENTSVYEFVCEDTGIGMSEEFLEHAFEPFTQEERSANSAYGSGLGLSIVRELVDRMGGKIALESRLNEGTKFSVSIPLRLDDRAEDSGTSDINGAGIEIAGKKALLAEDNELNMEIAVFLLEEEGLIIEQASNGKEAAEKFAASAVGEYDIIFMDVMMPVMNGLDAAGEIRRMDRPDAKTVPIVAMTANAFQDDIERSLAAGMNAHLTKPLDLSKVRETIKNVLSKKKM